MSELVPTTEPIEFSDDVHGFMVRADMIDGEPWFVAVDVAECLGLSNSRVMTAVLQDDERGVRISYTTKGPRKTNIISEGGLYTVVMRCQDAITPGTTAFAFRRWVTGEVLPAIRKSGSYSLPPIVETKTKTKTNTVVTTKPVAPKKLSGAYINSLTHFGEMVLTNLPNLAEPYKQAVLAQIGEQIGVEMPKPDLGGELFTATQLADEMGMSRSIMSRDKRYKGLKGIEEYGMYTLIHANGEARTNWQWNQNGRNAVKRAFNN